MIMTKPFHQVVYERFQLSPAYHMTHIDNLEGIIKDRGISCFQKMQGQNYKDISLSEVQNIRSTKEITDTGRTLHEYVPLYFGLKTPMVALRQEQNENLIFFCISLNILVRKKGCVISDGNAASTLTQFKEFKEIDDLGFLDVASIKTYKYAHDDEIKRKKQSELLVPDFLPIAEVTGIIVFSEGVRDCVRVALNRAGTNLANKIYVRSHGWYFVEEDK